MKEFSNSLYRNGENYYMQSLNLNEFAGTVETPCYVYDMDYVVAKYERLKKCFAYDKVQIFYAMKANYNPLMLKIMKENQ